MANPISDVKQKIHDLVSDALSRACAAGELSGGGELPDFVVEIPGDTSHGDFACNAAMVSARAFKSSPRRIAQAICDSLVLDGSGIERVEIAGPGFINFFLGSGWFSEVVSRALELGERYGRTDFGRGEKVQVEFVSANPTGPMHMGNARGGAIGDCLAAALDWAGYDVTREFYVNDAGNQIEKFASSLEARYLQIYQGEQAVPFPEDGYQGEDIRTRAQQFADENGDKYLDAPAEQRKKALVDYALPKNIAKLKADLEAYRIVYDVWFLESSLHSGAISEAIAKLTERGMTYEQEGALWYKATENGGEKDEVLVRANGFPTYFAADIAYHYNKFAVRGFSRVINVWGADHHGHVARLKGAMDAIGLDGSRLDIVLMQLVRLMKDGKPYKMSKRTGKAVSLTDLIEEVPVDAARFFFNMREPNSTFDFDLDLAVEQTSQNPVYYVQYANARICSLLRKLDGEGVRPRGCTMQELSLLESAPERELIRGIARFPQEIIDAAKNYDPARLTKYAVELASLYHKFYDKCPIRGADEPLRQARMSLCLATRTVLRNVLTLLKINVPDSM